ncbi:hypothetical protein CRUP_034393 [Coryphaenoides rupestris]|nr:hypothetical protein CRUP_034393 [Coryphaenoides rupestris]
MSDYKMRELRTRRSPSEPDTNALERLQLGHYCAAFGSALPSGEEACESLGSSPSSSSSVPCHTPKGGSRVVGRRGLCCLQDPRLLYSMTSMWFVQKHLTAKNRFLGQGSSHTEKDVPAVGAADGNGRAAMNARDAGGGEGTLGRRRRFENSEFTVRIYPGALAEGTIYCPNTTAAEAIERVMERLRLDRNLLLRAGRAHAALAPRCPGAAGAVGGDDYRFLLRQKNLDGSIHYGGSLQMWLRPEPRGDHADLCGLPELSERTLLENLRVRFRQEQIYTYVGTILIVINPFKFLPIYNPKHVKMYDNHTLGEMEPHIYAVADVAYHAMLQRRRNQCVVISGESGSGKTQSTNFLIHHLTALSQKGFASGVEQIILGAGPVLEVSKKC